MNLPARTNAGGEVRVVARALLGMTAWAGLAIASGGGVALAQDAPEPPAMTPPASTPAAADPSTDAPLNDPRLDEKVREKQAPRGPVPPVAPVSPGQGLRDVPSIPGLSLLDYRIPGRRALPEGTFISATPGKLVRAATGESIFIPADRGPGSIAPMILHATQRVEQLESATVGMDASTAVNLTGQVFSYRGQSHLLVTAFSLSNVPSTPSRAPANQEQIEAKAREEAAEGDARVATLLRNLETTRGAPRALQSIPLTQADTTPKPGATTRPPLNEGTLVVNRRGRLVRLAQDEGRLAFALDNDPDSPSTDPMRLLPCRALEEIERMAAARGDELVFRVSGRAMVYKGRSLLLPTLVQVVPPSDLAPLQ